MQTAGRVGLDAASVSTVFVHLYECWLADIKCDAKPRTPKIISPWMPQPFGIWNMGCQ